MEQSLAARVRFLALFLWGWLLPCLAFAQVPQRAAPRVAPRAAPVATLAPEVQAWMDLQTKSILNGALRAQASYEGDEASIQVSSLKTFKTPEDQAKAIHAARLIQRDVNKFCSAHCYALPMTAPVLSPAGNVRFTLRLKGLGRQLFQEELPSLLSGTPSLRAANLAH